MKKKIEKSVYFRDMTSLNCSSAGNPKKAFWVVCADGRTFWATTATNSSAGYAASNYASYYATIYKEIDGETWERTVEKVPRYADIEYHETKSGSVIVDYIRDAG